MDETPSQVAAPDLDRALRRADEDVARLKATIEETERWRKLLEGVQGGLPDAPAAVYELLAKNVDTLLQQDSADPETVAQLRELQSTLSVRAISAARDSVRTFGSAAEAAGLKFDTSSRHPRYSLYDHAIEIDLDERALRATVTVRHGDKFTLPLDISPLVVRLVEEKARLFDREWKPEAFLASLKKAYKPLSKKNDKVVLRDLAAAVSKPKKPRLDEFSVDLGRLLREPILETGPVKINLDQTRDTRQGLLLHGHQQSGYVLTMTMENRA